MSNWDEAKEFYDSFFGNIAIWWVVFFILYCFYNEEGPNAENIELAVGLWGWYGIGKCIYVANKK